MPSRTSLLTAYLPAWDRVDPRRPAPAGSRNPICLPEMPTQDDEWSCGPHSSTRLLKGYRHGLTYDFMRNHVGKQPIEIKVPVALLHEVDGCALCPPFDPLCRRVCRVATETIRTFSPPIDLSRWIGIGKPPRDLAARLTTIDGDVRYRSYMSTGDLEALIDAGKPVVVMGLEKTISRVETGLATAVAGVLLGIPPLPLLIPVLHYRIVVGYTNAEFILYDTYDNRRHPEARSVFYDWWDMKGFRANQPEAVYLAESYDLKRRSGIWIDRPIPANPTCT